jgi:hypothetical protein
MWRRWVYVGLAAIGAAVLYSASQSVSWDRLRTAITTAISATGTTYVGVGLWAVFFVGDLLVKLGREGWRGLTLDWRTRLKWNALLAGVFWLVLCVFKYVYPDPIILKPSEIAGHAQGLVVALMSFETFKFGQLDYRKVVKSGVRVDPRRYLVSCFKVDENADLPNVMVGSLETPFRNIEHAGTLAYSTYYASGQTVAYDDFNGLALVYSRAEPMGLDFNGRSILNGPSKISPLLFSGKMPSTGQRVFIFAAEQDQQHPAVATAEGVVTRWSREHDRRGRFHYRIHTSVPYKDTYDGAPVLNEQRQLVGVVHGGSDDSNPSCVLVPAESVMELMRKVGLR